MRRTIQRQRAEAFHRLHVGDGILVLVNSWDVARARLFEQAGSPAIATTSAGMAWSLGYLDGEQVYISQGKYAEAEPLCNRALAITEKALGPEHPSTAHVLENYAALMRKLNRESEAAKLEARAKGIREKTNRK